MIGLNKSAAVYTPNGSTGAYTVLAKSGLRVRLALVGVSEDGAPERVEDSGRRRLLFEPTYTMPARAKVVVDGVDWMVVEGTVAYPTGPGDVVIYGRGEVMAAE